MDQSALVGSLQAAAGLRNDVDSALDRKTVTGFAYEIFESGTGQQRHHEVRFFLALFFELSSVKNLNDVGMAHGGENVALLVEQLKGSRIRNVEDGFDRDFAAHDGVVGPIDQTHAALPEDLPHLVTASQFSG